MSKKELKPIFTDGCLTVAQLKEYIKDWPEVGLDGEPTEVWIETGRGLSSECHELWPLKLRKSDGIEASDILLAPFDGVWE